jgi:hypothetical protein
VLEGSGLGKCSGRPEISNTQLLLQGQAGRHDFAKYTGDIFIAEQTGVFVDQAPQYLCFARRAITVLLFRIDVLGLDHLAGLFGPLQNQIENTVIQCIDGRTQFFQ